MPVYLRKKNSFQKFIRVIEMFKKNFRGPQNTFSIENFRTTVHHGLINIEIKYFSTQNHIIST